MTNIKILESKITRLKKEVPIKLSLTCAYCGEEFVINYNQKTRKWGRSYKAMSRIFKALNEDTPITDAYCSKSCANKARDHSYMSKMNKVFEIYCKDCDFESKNGTPCLYKDDKVHYGSISTKCYTYKNKTSEDIGFKSGYECNGKPAPYFRNENNILFYKDKPWTECCKEFENGRIEPRIEKRYGVWTYNRRNPLTDEFLLYQYNFFKYQDVIYYKKRPWEEVKKEFNSRKPVELEVFAKEVGGFVQPTYLENDVDLTGKDALEQDLVDKGITWLTYIKFYKEITNYDSFSSNTSDYYSDETSSISSSAASSSLTSKRTIIRPIVAGKTGSKLVNKSGTDINFSLKDIEHCPARRLIVENKTTSWLKDFVVIIPCYSELMSFDVETYILDKYELFEG